MPDSKPIMPCGNVAAYKRHLRLKQTPCDACKAAWAVEAKRRYVPGVRSARRRAKVAG
jgi:hypothetical protein